MKEKLAYWHDRGRRDADRAARDPGAGGINMTRARRQLIRETPTSREQEAALAGYSERVREIGRMSIQELDQFFSG